MTKIDDFPLIISPNLGCPQIISIEEFRQKKEFSLIIAGQYGKSKVPLKDEFMGTLYLRRSHKGDGDKKNIPLSINDEPEEIIHWYQLSDFNTVDETREIISSEFHYNVMGENTRYWKIKVGIDSESAEGYETLLLPQKGGKYLPCLYDLVYRDRSEKRERVNFHSVQFVKSFGEGCKFIQVTDLHIATRNDEILDEVLKVKYEKISRDDIAKRYINFNHNLRKFIQRANSMAEEGELDFVVITGDLVDFAFHGWEDEIILDENNWKTFVNIITGAGKEKERNNPGIKIAVFTSTGNHDWRLRPYDPNLTKYNRDSFGLKEEELKHYKFKSFDSSEYPEDKRAKLAEEITSDALNRLNLDALKKTDKWKIKLEKFLGSIIGTWLMHILPLLGLIGIGEKVNPIANYVSHFIIAGIAGIATWGINKFIRYQTRKIADFIIDNPLHAEACALHYYFKYINPYLDYAFYYGNHCFIIMDTGSDIFIGQILDKKEIKYLKKIGLKDNVMGGAPDSKAFDPEQVYYNWSQIVWIEKVMETVSKKPGAHGRNFIFLHAPPINSAEHVDMDTLREVERKEGPGWVPEEECNLTYGTINYYLSEFFYLCMGYREGDLVKQEADRKFKSIDIVFSGHAHRNIEFRIEKDKNHEIRIYHDRYSETFDHNKPYAWWGQSPVIVQTASCGIRRLGNQPPYYRLAVINKGGQITEFSHANIP